MKECSASQKKRNVIYLRKRLSYWGDVHEMVRHNVENFSTSANNGYHVSWSTTSWHCFVRGNKRLWRQILSSSVPQARELRAVWDYELKNWTDDWDTFNSGDWACGIFDFISILTKKTMLLVNVEDGRFCRYLWSWRLSWPQRRTQPKRFQLCHSTSPLIQTTILSPSSLPEPPDVMLEKSKHLCLFSAH